MELKIYEKKKPQVYAKPSSVRLCHMTNKGYINFNVCATNEIGLSRGQKVLFAQDDETRSWYFSIGEGEKFNNGSSLNAQTHQNRLSSMRCRNKTVTNEILGQSGYGSATYHIAKKPVKQGGLDWYRLLTTTPYRANKQ